MKVLKLSFIKSFFFLLLAIGNGLLHAEGISCEELVGQVAFGTRNHYFFEDSSYYKKFGVDAFISSKRLLRMIEEVSLKAADLWVKTQNEAPEWRLTQEEEKRARKVFESFAKLFETDTPDCSGLLELQEIQQIAEKRFEIYMAEFLKEPEKSYDLNLPYYFSTLFQKESALNEAGIKKDLWIYFVSFMSDKDAQKDKLLQPLRYIQKQRRLGGESSFYAEYADVYFLALDPHSEHFNPTEHRAFNDVVSNNAAGIGIRTVSYGDTFIVTTIFKDGPTDKAKQEALKKGGDYLEVDDEITEMSQDGIQYIQLSNLSSSDAANLLVGNEGEAIYLRAKRKNLSRLIEVKLVRKKLDTNIVNPFYSGVVEHLGPDDKLHKVGVIRFLAFYEGVAEDVKKALDHLKTQGIESLVIDLRSNGGGSLGEAVKMVDLFISSAVVVQKRNGFGDIDEIPPRSFMDRGIEYTGPLVIALDKNSASASEVFSGTLSVYKRAVIVGNDTTFCKGSVQRIFELSKKPNGGALKLTVEGYFLPNGKSPQNEGVRSDIQLPFVRKDLFSPTANKGERSYANAIKFNEVDPFLSAEFAHGSGKTWVDVDENIVNSLKAHSEERLKKDPYAAKLKEYNSRVESIVQKATFSISEKLALEEHFNKQIKSEFINTEAANDDGAQEERLKYQPNTRMDDREILSVSTDLLSLITK